MKFLRGGEGFVNQIPSDMNTNFYYLLNVNQLLYENDRLPIQFRSIYTLIKFRNKL